MARFAALRSSSSFLLLLKMAAMFSALGGPLVVRERLMRVMHEKLAFAVVFSPVALLLFGVFALNDDDAASRGGRLSVRLGLVARGFTRSRLRDVVLCPTGDGGSVLILGREEPGARGGKKGLAEDMSRGARLR